MNIYENKIAETLKYGAVQALRSYADALERLIAKGIEKDPVVLARQLADMMEVDPL